MRTSFPIIGLLKHSRYLTVFLLVAGGMFYVNYYAMSKLPSSDGYQCLLGGHFTAGNMIFSILISIAAGLLGAGILAVHKEKKRLKSLKIGSASFVGLAIGTLTTFCTICTLPVISLFGLGVGLAFISEYEIYFKIASLLLIFVSLYLVNRQLEGDCKMCAF